MTMSVKLGRVHSLAERYNKTLKATDFDPNLVVIINHGDCTRYEFHSAFMMKLDHPDYNYGGEETECWVVVFTEHNGFHTFHNGDLNGYIQYRIDRDENQYNPEPIQPFPIELFPEAPPLPKRVFEGDFNQDVDIEDGGQARVHTISGDDEDGDMFVRVQSWDESCQHRQIKEFEGKKVRVTVEVID